MTDEIDPTIEDIHDDVNMPPKIRGSQLLLAPQPKLTAADNTAFSGSYDAAAINVITNMRTRIAELETRLNNLELLKKS